MNRIAGMNESIGIWPLEANVLHGRLYYWKPQTQQVRNGQNQTPKLPIALTVNAVIASANK